MKEIWEAIRFVLKQPVWIVLLVLGAAFVWTASGPYTFGKVILPANEPTILRWFGGVFIVLAVAAFWFSNLKTATPISGLKVTSPNDGEVLRNGVEIQGLKYCYRVTGTFRHLPEGFSIWLLTQYPGDPGLSPQGFHLVVSHKESRTWEGFIFAPEWLSTRQITLYAVAAPPTSQLLFGYYQRNGWKTNWDKLEGIPAECAERSVLTAIVP